MKVTNEWQGNTGSCWYCHAFLHTRNTRYCNNFHRTQFWKFGPLPARSGNRNVNFLNEKEFKKLMAIDKKQAKEYYELEYYPQRVRTISRLSKRGVDITRRISLPQAYARDIMRKIPGARTIAFF